MTAQPVRIDIKGAVPIPLGHAVEVWMLKLTGGVLEPDYEGPMVRHVETGILYGPSWAYGGGDFDQSAPTAVMLAARVTSLAHFEGRVEYCRVASTFAKAMDQVTTLFVRPISEAATAYR